PRPLPHAPEAARVARTAQGGATSALHGQRRPPEDPLRALPRPGAGAHPGAPAARPGARAAHLVPTSPVRGMRGRSVNPIFRGMRRSTTEHVIPALTLGFAGAVVPFASIYFVAHRHVMFSGQAHFVGVGLTALAAALAAVVLTIAGARRRDGRTVLVGTAFTVMASLLALHGIATPGILIGDNGVVAFTGGATLPVGAAVLSLTALPALRRPRSVRPLVYFQIGLLCAVLSLGVVGM